jgi:hypothetical protein
VGDEVEQVCAIYGGVAEAFPSAEPVRVQAAAADLPRLAGLALIRQGSRANLPGNRRRMVKGLIEAARHDVQPGVGGAGISRAERVKLLDRAVGVDHDQRAREQPEALHLAGVTENELDQLAEHPDPRFLPRRAVPPLEDRDEPLRVPVAGWGQAPVRVREQQVECRGAELQQRLVRGYRIVLDVDRAQDAAIAAQVFRRPKQLNAVGHRVEAVAPIGVAPVPPSGLGVTVQAYTNLDSQALERSQHGAVEERAVGLDGHVHLGGHGGMERTDQLGQPIRTREQRLAAVQDDVHTG